jgi:hypothetical protein
MVVRPAAAGQPTLPSPLQGMSSVTEFAHSHPLRRSVARDATDAAPPALPTASQPIATANTAPQADQAASDQEIAERVYRLLVDRLGRERARRGL